MIQMIFSSFQTSYNACMKSNIKHTPQPCKPLCTWPGVWVSWICVSALITPESKCNSSMYLCIHQSFVSCQLVDRPKLQYQILLDVHHVHKQPNGVTPKLHALIDGQIHTKNISPTSCRRSSWSISARTNPDWKNLPRFCRLHPFYRSM